MHFTEGQSCFRQLFEMSPDPCWIIEGERFVACNDAAIRALGYATREALLNTHPSQHSPATQPDGADSHEKAGRMIALARQAGVHRFEWLHTRADGSAFEAEVTLSRVQLSDREIIYCVWRDISGRKQTEHQLRESEQHYRTLANGGSTLIWTSGLDMGCNYFNEPWLKFTGRTLAQELGNGWTEGVHPDDFEGCLKTYVEAFDRQHPFSMDYRIRRADGAYRWIRDDGNPRYDSEGNFLGYIGFCMDITDKRLAEETIRNLAYYDTLTGLPNRRLLLDRLDKALAAGARHGRAGALLFIDLDNFKAINDTLGHDAGDLLLQETARRLASCLRKGDTAARFGGDEFVVLLDYLDENHQDAIEQTRTVGSKILQLLGQPYPLEGNPHQCTPSIGVTLYRGQEKSSDEILRQADLQMYKAKQAGRNALRFFGDA